MATSRLLTKANLDRGIVNGLEDIASRLNISQPDLDGLIRSALEEASLESCESTAPSVFRYSCQQTHYPLSDASVAIDDPVIALGAEIFFADE